MDGVIDALEEDSIDALFKAVTTLLFTAVFAFAYCTSYENFQHMDYLAEMARLQDENSGKKKKK